MKYIFEHVHFNSETWRFILPFIMMGIDIVTGLIYAWSSSTFRSAKMRSGLSKKAGEAIILILGELATYGLGLPDEIMTAISVYIIVMELMSVIENLDKLGVPVPSFIRTKINNNGEEINELIKTIAEMEKKEDVNDKK